MPKAPEPFADVPLDEDTRVLSQELVSIGEWPALYQTWVWDGVLGVSLILRSADAQKVSDHELLRLAEVEGYSLVAESSTINRSDSGFVFINFGFDAD